jgi:hypothetical protein
MPTRLRPSGLRSLVEIYLQKVKSGFLSTGHVKISNFDEKTLTFPDLIDQNSKILLSWPLRPLELNGGQFQTPPGVASKVGKDINFAPPTTADTTADKHLHILLVMTLKGLAILNKVIPGHFIAKNSKIRPQGQYLYSPKITIWHLLYIPENGNPIAKDGVKNVNIGLNQYDALTEVRDVTMSRVATKIEIRMPTTSLYDSPIRETSLCVSPIVISIRINNISALLFEETTSENAFIETASTANPFDIARWFTGKIYTQYTRLYIKINISNSYNCIDLSVVCAVNIKAVIAIQNSWTYHIYHIFANYETYKRGHVKFLFSSLNIAIQMRGTSLCASPTVIPTSEGGKISYTLDFLTLDFSRVSIPAHITNTNTKMVLLPRSFNIPSPSLIFLEGMDMLYAFSMGHLGFPLGQLPFSITNHKTDFFARPFYKSYVVYLQGEGKCCLKYFYGELIPPSCHPRVAW